VPHRYIILGTDGRSDTRRQLHKFFEVDRHYIVYIVMAC
jgi:pyruvate dehydrogenase E1 component